VTESVTPDVRWKRWLRRVLLVVSCLSLVLAVVTLWVRIQIDNTDRFTRTVDPVASDPAIQEAVVVKITDGFSAWLSEAQNRDTLIDREGYLAAPINQLLTNYVEEIARSVVTSDEFQVFWDEAMLIIHPQLSAILTGSDTDNMTTQEGTITIDLAPLVEAVKTRLVGDGVDLFSSIPTGTIDTTFVLVDSDDLAEIQGLVEVLYKLSVVFPIVAVIGFAVYLWLTPNRRGGVIRAGLAIAATMALVLALLSVARDRYLDGLSSDVSRDATAAFFDIIGRYLRAAIRLIALLGLLIAGLALVTRPGAWLSRMGASVKERVAGGTGNTGPTWVGQHRALLLGFLLAVSCLLVITPNRVTEDWWQATLILLVVGLTLILLASRSTTHLKPNSTPTTGEVTGVGDD
jgi:hypothetical protein